MKAPLIAAAAAVLLGACSGTESNPPVEPNAPTGWIYYAEARLFNPRRTIIWRIRPDGTQREQISTPEQGIAGPEFDITQDGRRLVMNRATTLLVVPVEAPDESFVLTNQNRIGPIRWSPSGHSMANTRIDNGVTGRWQIYLTPRDFSPESLLLDSDPENGIWPLEWFPDGDSLVYLDVQRGVRVLRLHDLSTRALTPIGDRIRPSPSGRFGLDWQVDSVEYDTKKHWRLYDLSTEQLVREVTHRYSPHRVAWSPAERHFVDQCQEVPVGDGQRGLCVYHRATMMPITKLADPTPETYLDYPRWIP